MEYIYGVEKSCRAWHVRRFQSSDEADAVAWLTRGGRGSVRWLCNRDTAIEMAGERALCNEGLTLLQQSHGWVY